MFNYFKTPISLKAKAAQMWLSALCWFTSKPLDSQAATQALNKDVQASDRCVVALFAFF